MKASNLNGTHAKEFFIGKGDIDVAGNSIVGFRTNADGLPEYKKAGGKWTLVGALQDLVKEPSGFLREELDQAVISVDDATRTFTLTPTGSYFRFFIKGVEYRKSTPQSVVFDDASGVHHFIFDETGTLVHTDDIDVWISAVLGSGATVSFLVWDAIASNAIFIAEERHGMMAGEAHAWMHLYFGMQWESGGALYDVSAGASGDDDSHAKFGVSPLECADEDLRFRYTHNNPQALDTPVQIPIYYRIANRWVKKTSDDYPVVWSDGVNWTGPNNRCAFNEDVSGQGKLTEVNDRDLFLVHYFTSNEITEPIIGILGQKQYTTPAKAKVGATEEIHKLVTEGLNIAEFREIGTVIWQTSGGAYTNTPHARIVVTEDGDPYLDWRYNSRQGGGGGGIIKHGNLIGLDDDDHKQYQLVRDRLSTKGDIAFHDGTDVTRLAVGADGAYLGVENGVPEWKVPPGQVSTPYALENYKIAGAEVENIISVGTAYRMKVLPEITTKVTRLAVACTSFSGTGLYVVGIYKDATLIAHETLSVSKKGINYSNAFTEITLEANVEYWFAVAPEGTGASSYLAGLNTNTTDVVAQQLSVATASAELPPAWSPEASANISFWIASVGEVSISASQSQTPVGPLPIIKLTDSNSIEVVDPTVELLTWNTELDKDAPFSHDNATNSSRITVTQDGVYLIGGTVRIEDDTERDRYSGKIIIRINGADVEEYTNSYLRGYGTIDVDLWDCLLPPVPYKLTAGDYVELAYTQASSGSGYRVDLLDWSRYFWMVKLESASGTGGGYVDPLTNDGDLLYRSSGITTRLPKGSIGEVLQMGSAEPYWSTAPGGSGGPLVKIFEATDSIGGMGLTTIKQPIELDQEIVKDSYYSHSITVDNAEVTILTGGDFWIDARSNVQTDSSAGGYRGNPVLVVEKSVDGGSSWAALPAFSGGYIREDANYKLSTTMSFKLYVSLNTNDKLRMVVHDTVSNHPVESLISYGSALAISYIDRTGAASGVVNALNDIGDVQVPTPADGDTLVYDGALGKWINAAPIGGSGDSFSYYDAMYKGTEDGSLALLLKVYTQSTNFYPTSDPFNNFKDSLVDPFIVDGNQQVIKATFVCSGAASGSGAAATNPTARVEMYRIDDHSETLLAAMRVPLSVGSFNTWNNVTAGWMKGSLVLSTPINLYDGDLIGFRWVPEIDYGGAGKSVNACKDPRVKIKSKLI